MSEDSAKPIHTVSVRDLVEFVLRRGDLGGQREFVGSDRALAGIRGHQKIQRSRPTGYLTELPVEHRVEVEEFTLLIRGRIDGLLITSERILLEEIKTVSASWRHEADPLHWAQAKFYGFMHAHENALKELVVQLVYLELPAGKVTEFRETASFAELSDFFITTTNEYVTWLWERQWLQKTTRLKLADSRQQFAFQVCGVIAAGQADVLAAEFPLDRCDALLEQGVVEQGSQMLNGRVVPHSRQRVALSSWRSGCIAFSINDSMTAIASRWVTD